MKNKTLTSFMVSSATLLLIGCGGGGGDTPTQTITPTSDSVTKVIVDDPIAGLNYLCSSSTEVKKTTAKGEFTCLKDDTVTFKIGNYTIGSASTQSGQTQSLRIADLNLTSEAVTDVRQILQTIDANSDDGTIEIPEDFDAFDELDIQPGDATFDTVVANVVAQTIGKTLVDEATANKQAEESYLAFLLNGKTYYIVEDKDLSTLTFTQDNDVKKVQWKSYISQEIDPPSTYDINGSSIVVTDAQSGKIMTFAIGDETNTTITLHAPNETVVLYKTLDDAKAYMQSAIPTDFIKVDSDADTQGSNVAHDGFELTTLQAYVEDDKLVITLNAKGDIQAALATQPHNGFDNILWISIFDYEFGLLGDGTHYMTKEHWENGEWVEGVNVTDYTLFVEGTTVILQLPLSALPQNVLDLDYVLISATIAEDQTGAPDNDESEDDEIIYDDISTVVQLSKSTISTPTSSMATLLQNKILYTTIYNRIKTLETMTFNEDFTEATWVEINGGSCSGSVSITPVDDTHFDFTALTDSCSSEDIGKTERLSLVQGEDGSYILFEGQRAFFTQDEAIEYFTTNGVKNFFLEGERFYANVDGSVGSLSLNTDGTYTGTLITNENDTYLLGGTYEVSSDLDTIILHNSSDNMTITITYKEYSDIYEGEIFSLEVQDSDGNIVINPIDSYLYKDATQRDDARAQYIADHS